MATFTRNDIIRVARSYIGTPFRLYGRERTGVDCVGLLYCLGKDLGIEVDNYTNYKATPEPAKLQLMLDAYTYPTTINPPRNGQILKLRQLVFPMHVGVLVVEGQRLSVINANVKAKRVIEEPYSTWKDLVLEHREIFGVTD